MTFITFLTAYLGYLLLTVNILSRLSGRQDYLRWSVPALFGIATLHVLLVWGHRFGFDPGQALRNGIATAVALHSAYILIVGHFLGHRHSALAAKLVYPAWALVSFFGTAASFGLDYVSWLRAPMVITLLVGVVGMVMIRTGRFPGRLQSQV